MSEVLGCWIDGVAGQTLPADDRGLAYGDGLFETILIRGGRARFLEAHLTRLSRGLVALGIPFTEMPTLRADIANAALLAPALAVLKVIVTRGSAARRGYAPPAEVRARRIVSLWPTEPVDGAEQGINLRVARLRVPEQSPFAGIKHLNRLENVMAAAEGLGGMSFEALLLDTHDSLVSGTSSNVFVVHSGEIKTPPTDRAGVAGVMRSIVLREAPKLGINAHQQVLTLEDVYAADEVFITNARIGVVPVKRVREHAFTMFRLALKLRVHIESLDA
jgi:4-amino-4-deoxychorismate lyase